MRLLFVDDSGSPTPRRAEGDSGLYILAGLAIDDKDLPSFAEAACSAKAAVGEIIGLDEWEAHAYDVWNNAGQFRDKRHMLTVEQKRDVFSAMIEVVAGSRLRVVPVVVVKQGGAAYKTKRRPLVVAWTAMLGRFERMLDASRGECGLVLADAGSRADECAVQSIVERTGRAGMDCASDGGILNGVIHRDSRRDIAVQMADTVAYVVHKHYRKNAHFSGWFESIRPKFDACYVSQG